MIAIDVADPRCIKKVKTLLESHNVFLKPMETKDGGIKRIRTLIENKEHELISIIGETYGSEVEIVEIEAPVVDDHETKATLLGYTQAFLSKLDYVDTTQEAQLLAHLPLKFTVYQPLVLFNHSRVKSFLNGPWNELFTSYPTLQRDYFEGMLRYVKALKHATHVATNGPIPESSNTIRAPLQICPLYNDLVDASAVRRETMASSPDRQDFALALWCETRQNGIWQTWAPQFTMFSRGNVTEKQRILTEFPEIEGHDVVDLYCGIGYFTLSYLKRDARQVFAFDINPWSIEGLRRALKRNGFADRSVHVFQESNERSLERLSSWLDTHHPPSLDIRHINLGLLPTSRQGWPVALQIIHLQESFNAAQSTERKTGARTVTLHIHENVHVNGIAGFPHATAQELQELDAHAHFFKPVHLQRIKTYAPDVWHVCLDVDVLQIEPTNPKVHHKIAHNG